jgi:hypothetical protein
VKNDLGETIRVYVVSPGYVMAYKVQPQRLTPDPWSPPPEPGG